MDVKITGGNTNNSRLVLDNKVIDQILSGQGKDLPIEIHIHDIDGLRRYFNSKNNKDQKITIEI